ncbi:aminopeptidase [Mesorhizobium sp. M1428]|uniref:aminopeptidase n=1 Tax=unclassified Mesorhizobium TaxID=325217 RepID=UPI003335E558
MRLQPPARSHWRRRWCPLEAETLCAFTASFIAAPDTFALIARGLAIQQRVIALANLAEDEGLTYTSKFVRLFVAGGNPEVALSGRESKTVMRAFVRLVAAIILTPGVASCTSISYYAQSLQGHVQIMTARQDVGKLINDPSTPEILRAQMASANAIRQFAIDELALPDNNSYRSYVDVGRDSVTWAVFAAPEFSLTPRTWCFPVFGCVPYRGYFSEESATETAAELQRQGLDVYVTGITAYSTLGWSSDPLLSTMLTQDGTYLAGLVFHELAHQRVYVHNDSAFNEAFAVAVETTGVRKWLRATGDTAGLRRYEADRRRRAEFLALVSRTRDELGHVYHDNGTSEQKRAAKTAAIERLRTRYRQMRDKRWGGYRGYDAWFDAPINNAKLAATSVYSDRVPAFLQLFDLCSGDYPRFYAAVRRLGALDKARRTEALAGADACYGDSQS